MNGPDRRPSRGHYALIGIALVAVLVVISSGIQKRDSSVLARSVQWSEHIGMGEIFPACGSSFVLPCDTPANACGMVNSGTIQSDGNCSVASYPDSSCPVPITPSLGVSAPQTPVVDSGTAVTLIWNSPNATSCRWAGGFANNTVGPSGTATTSKLTETTTFQLCCAFASGVCGPSTQLTITVMNPFVELTAQPLRVRIGGASMISWSTKDVKNCVVTRNGAIYKKSSGEQDVITTQTIYRITCDTNSTPITKSSMVNVVPLYKDF